MTFEAGGIVLIPFPFSDLHSTKKRPVLLLTAPDHRGDFIALAITSKVQHTGAVFLTSAQMASGTLPRPSWIRTDKVFTLSQDLIAKEIGKVRPETMDSAREGLCRTVGQSADR